MATNHSIKK